MANITMKAKDAISAKLAECFVTIEGRRYNFMQAINLEATFEKTKTEVPILGKTGTGHKATGWNGTGKRISIKDTRGIIDAILNGSINNCETKTIPYFNLEVPTSLPGVDTKILDSRDTYSNPKDWETKALDLAGRFIDNFKKYENNPAGKALVKAGPKK